MDIGYMHAKSRKRTAGNQSPVTYQKFQRRQGGRGHYCGGVVTTQSTTLQRNRAPRQQHAHYLCYGTLAVKISCPITRNCVFRAQTPTQGTRSSILSPFTSESQRLCIYSSKTIKIVYKENLTLLLLHCWSNCKLATMQISLCCQVFLGKAALVFLLFLDAEPSVWYSQILLND